MFLFGSNFKMHGTPADTERFIRDLRALDPPDAQLFLIPPFTSLERAAGALSGSTIWLGAQTVHWAKEGAFTGAISAPMVRAAGAELVMLGHAEQRQHFGETDALISRKVPVALDAGLRVLLCVGETREQRDFGVEREAIAVQLKTALHEAMPTQAERLLVAYEPVWAIGEGGAPAPPQTVATMMTWIHALLAERFGEREPRVPVLYGGSVNRDNCAGYARLDEVDGLFVGRAAWRPEGFVEVLSRALESIGGA